MQGVPVTEAASSLAENTRRAYLGHQLFVHNGATLTIEAGTLV